MLFQAQLTSGHKMANRWNGSHATLRTVHRAKARCEWERSDAPQHNQNFRV